MEIIIGAVEHDHVRMELFAAKQVLPELSLADHMRMIVGTSHERVFIHDFSYKTGALLAPEVLHTCTYQTT